MVERRPRPRSSLATAEPDTASTAASEIIGSRVLVACTDVNDSVEPPP